MNALAHLTNERIGNEGRLEAAIGMRDLVFVVQFVDWPQGFADSVRIHPQTHLYAVQEEGRAAG
jgi:hypothetical protein